MQTHINDNAAYYKVLLSSAKQVSYSHFRNVEAQTWEKGLTWRNWELVCAHTSAQLKSE